MKEKSRIKEAVKYFNEGIPVRTISIMRELLETDESLSYVALFLYAIFEQSLAVLQGGFDSYEILLEAEKYCYRFFPIKGLNSANVSNLQELAVIVPRIKCLLEDRDVLLDECNAIEIAERVAELLPQDPSAWYSLAWILCRKGEYSAANDAIDKAWGIARKLDLGHVNPVLFARINLCQAKINIGLGNKEYAMVCYSDAKQTLGKITFQGRVATDMKELEELKIQLGI